MSKIRIRIALGEKALTKVSAIFLMILILSSSTYFIPFLVGFALAIDGDGLATDQSINIKEKVEVSVDQFNVTGTTTSSTTSTTETTTTTIPTTSTSETTTTTSTTTIPTTTKEVDEKIKDVENNEVGKKIRDESDYETFFDFIGKVENNFVIKFYHNSSSALPIWIEGNIDYEINATSANPFEVVALKIPLIDNKIPKFRLHVGYDSEIFEFGITIITVQSYPAVNGNWTVEFTTVGTANLTVTAMNNTEFGKDLKFLKLKCGNNILTTELTDGVIFVENYTCDEIGYEVSKVLIAGKHTLEFRFGDDVEYAYNQVGQTRIKTVEFLINTTNKSVAANGWFNSTFFIQLPENTINVKSAWFEISGVSPQGVAGSIQNYLNNTLLAVQTNSGGSETFGFTYLLNGTNMSVNAAGGLYDITDNSVRAYVLSLGSLTSTHAVLSAKAVITYAYDDASTTQIHTDQFFVNQSQNSANLASGTWFNSTFKIMLSGPNPSVKSAWFEVGGIFQSTISGTLRKVDVALNGSRLHVSPYDIDDGGTTDETASYIINVNATGRDVGATSIYNINNNNEYAYTLGIRANGSTDVFSAPHAKLYITYTTNNGQVNQTTQEIFVNSTGAASAAGTIQNWMFPVQLFGNNPKVKSAWFEIYGATTGAATRVNATLNATPILSATTVDLAQGESDSFRVFANASKIFEITDNSRRNYLLSIGCVAAACNAFSARLIVTYNFTSMPNQTTATFYVNSTPYSVTAATFFNSSFNVKLEENSPIVQRAFYDIIGSMGGTSALTVTAMSGNAALTFDTTIWPATGGSGTPYYRLHSVYNATNSTSAVTGMPYEITDNSAHTYDLSLQCSGVACFNLGSKLVMLYSFSTVPPDTTPPQWSLPAVNTTNPHRGEGVNISALWQDTGNGLDKAWLSTNESGVWRNYTNVYGSPRSLSGTSPLTVNFSWVNSTGKPRVIGWAIYANDTGNKQNATSQGNFTLWGWSNITWSDPHSGDSFDVSSIIQLVAFVNDTNNTGSGPIENYPVNFSWRNSTHEFLLGTSLTNSTGHALWNWNTGELRPGTYYPKANITNNGTLFYNASQFYQTNTTVILSALPITNLVNTSLSFSLSDLSGKSSTGVRKPIFAMSLSGMISKIQSLLKFPPLSFSLQSALFKSATSLKLPLGSFSLASLSSKAQGYLKSITGSLSLSSISGKLLGFYKSLSLSINMQAISGRFSSIYKSLAASLTVNQFAGKVLVVTKQLSQSFNLSGAVTKTFSFVKGIQQGLQLSSISTRLNIFYKSLSSSISLQSLSSRASTLYKSLSQSFSLQSNIKKFYTATYSAISSFSLSDVRTRLISATRPISQNIALQSLSTKIFSTTKILSQSFNLTSITAKLISFSKSMSASFGLNSITGKFSTFLKTTASALQLNTISGKLMTLVKSLSGSISIKSSSSKFTGLVKLVTASVNLQSISARMTTVYKFLQQGFSTSAIIVRIPAFFKGISQSLQLSSITARLVSIIRIPSQSLSFSLAVLRTRLLTANVFSSFSLSGAMTRVLNFIKIPTASLSLTSTASKFPIWLRTLQQSFTTNAITAKAISFFKGISQSLQLSSVTARLISIIRIPTQSLSLSILTIRSQILTTSTSLTLSLTGNVVKMLSSIRASLTSLSLNSAVSKFLTLPKSIQQSLSLGSITGKFSSFLKTTTSSLQLNVISAKLINVVKSLTSSISIQALSSKFTGFYKSLQQNISTNVISARIVSAFRSITSNISLSSASSKFFILLKAMQQSFSLSSITGRIGSIYKSAQQSLSTNAITSKAISFFKGISQSLQLNSISSRFGMIYKSIVSSLNLQSLSARIFSTTKTLSQSLGFSGITSKFISFSRLALGSFGFSSATGKFSVFLKTIVSSLQLNSMTARVLSIIKLSSQSLSLSLAAIRNQILTVRILSAFSLFDLAGGIKTIGMQTSDRLVSLTISLTGNATRILNSIRLSLSSLSMNFTIGKFLTLPKSIQQSLQLSSLSTKIISIIKTSQLSLSASGAMARMMNFLKVSTSSFSMTSASSKLSTWLKATQQSFGLNTVTGKIISFTKTIQLNLQLQTISAKIMSNLRFTASSLSFSGLVTKTQTFVKYLSQLLSMSSIADRLFGIQRTIAVSFNLQAISSRFLAISKSVSQSLQLNSLTGKLLSAIRAPSQSLSVSLVAIRSQLLTARVFSSFSFSDLAAGLQAFGPTTYNKLVSLTLSVTGNMTRVLDAIRISLTSLSLNSAISKFLVLPKSISASLSLSSISGKFSSFLKSMSQSLSISSVITKVSNFYKSAASSFSLDSITSRLKIILRLGAGSFSMSGLIVKSQTFIQSLIQSMSLSSISARFSSVTRTITTSFNLSGVITKIYSTFRNVTGSFSLTSITTRFMIITKAISQNFNINALSVKASSFFRIIATSIQLQTITARFSSVQKSISASINLQAVSDRIKIIYKSLQQSFSASVVATRGLMFFRGIGQSLQMNTVTARLLSVIKSSMQSVSISLNAVRSQFFLAKVISSFNISDWANAIRAQVQNRFASLTISINGATTKVINSIRALTQAININSLTGRVVSFLRISTAQFNFIFSLFKKQLKANGQYCSQNSDCVSNLCCSDVCQSACPTGVTLSLGGGGGGVGIITPPTVITLPTTSYVEFSKMSVFQEVIPGELTATGITISNKGNSNLTGLHIEVSGIPKEWVKVSPDTLDLKPNETSRFSIEISVPDIVAFGDYKAVVTLKNDIVEDTSFFIVRAKSYSKEEDKPLVSRFVEKDETKGKTNVELKIYNPSGNWSYAEVEEYIPKEIANSTDFIEFETSPSRIIQKDPVVSWEMFDLHSGETRKIYYSVPKVAEEFTPYIYWPVKSLNLIKAGAVSNLEIVDFKISTLYPGRSSAATLSIRNLDDSQHTFGFNLKMPRGWETEPINISKVIMAKEMKDFTISVLVPEKTLSGYYVIRGEFMWDDGFVIKEYGVWVGTFIYFSFVIIITIIIVVGLLLVYLYYKRREKERRYHVVGKLEKIRKGLRRSYYENR